MCTHKQNLQETRREARLDASLMLSGTRPEDNGFLPWNPAHDDWRDEMNLTRRTLMLAAATAPGLSRASASAPLPAPTSARLPDRESFPGGDVVYLDSGTMHPISPGARAALQTYMEHRSLDLGSRVKSGFDDDQVRKKFARLINADSDEVAFVQSTTAGENLILQALGLPEKGAHVVTDTLHFFGSFPAYEDLAKSGVEVTWLQQKEGRISIDDVERAVRKGTRLVALSLVSTFNGFQHDLRRVCEIAHAKGALVYADIVHAAGCIPVDVRESGVDFAACASYKWLMGDFGLGFLYVRKDRQANLRRPQSGYYQISEFKTHVYPLDTPGDSVADYVRSDSAQGLFAIGTFAHPCLALLNHSLDYIGTLGVGAIQAHATSLTDHLKSELPKLGYQLYTPAESKTPLVACVMKDARGRLSPRLDAAKVKITLSQNRFRVSVSVFNDMTDIDRLLSALGVQGTAA